MTYYYLEICLSNYSLLIFTLMKQLKQLKKLFATMGTTLTLLALVMMSVMVASCGDDDDDKGGSSGGGTKNPEQLIRQKWVVQADSDIPYGYTKAYMDLTGKTIKTAFQYKKSICDNMGLDPDTWYEGLDGDLMVEYVKEDDAYYVISNNIVLFIVESGKMTTPRLGQSVTLAPDNLKTQKLPAHDLLASLEGQWQSLTGYTEMSFLYGNLLYIQDAPFVEIAGRYYHQAGASLLVGSTVYSTVYCTTTGGGSQLSFTQIDNDHIQQTFYSDFGSDVVTDYIRLSPKVTIE